MSCCGNKRTAATLPKTTVSTPTSRPFMAARPVADPRPAPVAPPPRAVQSSPSQATGLVRLRYLARAGVLVRGPRSGTPYRFSENQPVLAVQRADAEAMLASGHFRREA